MIFVVKERAQLPEIGAAVEMRLKEWGVSDERAFDSKLVATELMSNSFKHTQGEMTWEIALKGNGVEITARYAKPFFPPKQTAKADVYAEGGRGLFLVDKLSDKRTCTPDGAIQIIIKSE